MKDEGTLTKVRQGNAKMSSDLVILAAVAILAFVGSATLDVFENLSGWIQAHKAWEIHEIAPALVIIVFVLAGFFLYRWRNLASEITERQRMEQERENLLQALEDKTEELEQIVYVTSHDLRSPLVNIQGFARELEQSLKEVRLATQSGDMPPAVSEKLAVPMNEDIPDALNYILASTSKIDSLLSGLLRLSRLGRAALNIKNLDMNQLMAEVTRAFEFNIKKAGVTLEVERLPSCRGDQTQIDQVFSNLIDNALKFLDPGRPGVIRVSGRKDNGRVICCVADNGIGIAPQHQQKVFEIFQRLDPGASSGEGLGLTIARRILDRNSGKIWLESEPGKGSQFLVSLPAS